MCQFFQNKLILVLVVFCSLGFAREKNCAVDSSYLQTARHGPFMLMNSSGDTVQVYVEVNRVHWGSILHYQYQETDCSFSFLDSAGNVLYRINYPSLEGTGRKLIRPAQLVIPFGRPVILVTQVDDPSGPGPELTGQLFDMDQFDNIIPITDIMSSSDVKHPEVSAFRPVLVRYDCSITDSLRSYDPFAVPWIETKSWTGNFSVFIFNRIRRYGQLFFGRFPENRVEIDTVSATRQRRRAGTENASIRIYFKPERIQSNSRSVRLRSSSSIRFLSAVSRGSWWLHVIVDGTEGYVTHPDFSKLGLPDSG